MVVVWSHLVLYSIVGRMLASDSLLSSPTSAETLIRWRMRSLQYVCWYDKKKKRDLREVRKEEEKKKKPRHINNNRVRLRVLLVKQSIRRLRLFFRLFFFPNRYLFVFHSSSPYLDSSRRLLRIGLVGWLNKFGLIGGSRTSSKPGSPRLWDASREIIPGAARTLVRESRPRKKKQKKKTEVIKSPRAH